MLALHLECLLAPGGRQRLRLLRAGAGGVASQLPQWVEREVEATEWCLGKPSVSRHVPRVESEQASQDRAGGVELAKALAQEVTQQARVAGVGDGNLL